MVKRRMSDLFAKASENGDLDRALLRLLRGAKTGTRNRWQAHNKWQSILHLFIYDSIHVHIIITCVYIFVYMCKWASDGVEGKKRERDNRSLVPRCADLHLCLSGCLIWFVGPDCSKPARWKRFGDAASPYSIDLVKRHITGVRVFLYSYGLSQVCSAQVACLFI